LEILNRLLGPDRQRYAGVARVPAGARYLLVDSSLRAFADGPHRQPAQAGASVRRRTQTIAARMFRRESNHWRRAALDQRTPQSLILECLQEIAVLALLIVGGEDQPEAIALSEDMADGIPDACLLRVQGAGHHASREVPDAVPGEIRRWLAAAGSRAPAPRALA